MKLRTPLRMVCATLLLPVLSSCGLLHHADDSSPFAPTVSDVSPASGSTDGGTLVALVGSHLNGATVLCDGVPVLVSAGTVPAVQTSRIVFRGNLSTTAGIFTGTTLTALFPLVAADSAHNSTPATGATVLSTLTTFSRNFYNDPFVAPGSPQRDVYAFGTRPDGTAYAGVFTINPWTNTVADLVARLNGVLLQGTDQFAQVSLSGNVLTAQALDAGQGFSLYLGERDPIQQTANLPAVGAPPAGASGAGVSSTTGTTTVFATFTATQADAGAYDPTFTINGAVTTSSAITVHVKVGTTTVGAVTLPAASYANGQSIQLPSFPNIKPGDVVTYEVVGPASGNTLTFDFATTSHGLDDSTGVSFSGAGPARTIGGHTVQPGEEGLLQPSFTVPADTYGGVNGSLSIAVKINGTTVGMITPSGTLATPTAFSLGSFPHVAVGDVATYELSGTKATAAPITTSTQVVADNNSGNLTADTDHDGTPDFLQDGSSSDANAWQYEKQNNDTMNWYRMRFVPALVGGTISVFDGSAAAHLLSYRFLHVGSTLDTMGSTPVLQQVWDLVWDVRPEEGTLIDDLVTGLFFDENGNFLGNGRLGATAHGTALSDSSIWVGAPIDNTIRVDWTGTGVQTMRCDLGEAGLSNGLTSTSAASDASATSQDGDPALSGLQRLLFQTPAHAAGAVDIEVRTGEGRRVLRGGFMYLASTMAAIAVQSVQETPGLALAGLDRP